MQIQPCCWTNEEEPPLHSISLVKVCCWAQKETKILTRQKLRSSWGEKSPKKMLFILRSYNQACFCWAMVLILPWEPQKTQNSRSTTRNHRACLHSPLPPSAAGPISMETSQVCLWHQPHAGFHLTLSWRLNACVLCPHILMLNTSPQCDSFCSKGLWEASSHESGIPLNGISTLYKIPHRVLWLPPSREDTATTSMNQEAKPSPDSESASGMPLNLPASRIPRNEQLFLSCPAYGTVLQ